MESTRRPASSDERRRLLSPDREFVSRRIGEVEAPPAREREDRLHDLAARLLDARLCLLELARVEDDQRRAALRCFSRGNSAGYVRVLERRVVGTPVLERPSKRVAVEFLRDRYTAHVELDIVDAVVRALRLLFVCHVCLVREV